jgi:predicted choloylglycine hydrolase
LAIQYIVDRDQNQRIQELARVMVGSHQDADCLDLALRVATAELDLLQVRAVRTNIANGRHLRPAGPDSETLVAELASCERYERRAFSRRQKAMRQFDLHFGQALRSLPPDHVE